MAAVARGTTFGGFAGMRAARGQRSSATPKGGWTSRAAGMVCTGPRVPDAGSARPGPFGLRSRRNVRTAGRC